MWEGGAENGRGGEGVVDKKGQWHADRSRLRRKGEGGDEGGAVQDVRYNPVNELHAINVIGYIIAGSMCLSVETRAARSSRKGSLPVGWIARRREAGVR